MILLGVTQPASAASRLPDASRIVRPEVPRRGTAAVSTDPPGPLALARTRALSLPNWIRFAPGQRPAVVTLTVAPGTVRHGAIASTPPWMSLMTATRGSTWIGRLRATPGPVALTWNVPPPAG